jgi:hypothetical protein
MKEFGRHYCSKRMGWTPDASAARGRHRVGLSIEAMVGAVETFFVEAAVTFVGGGRQPSMRADNSSIDTR